MRRWLLAGTLIIIATLSVGSAQTHATPLANQADITVVKRASTAYQAFTRELYTTQPKKDSIDERAKQAATAFAVVAEHSFSAQLGDEYSRHAAAVKEKASAVKTLLGRAPQAFASKDTQAAAVYLTDVETAVSQYDSAVGVLNTTVDDANQATNRLYLFMVIGAGLVAALAAVWARRQHTRTFASKRVVRARWAVVAAAAAPLVGAVSLYVIFIQGSDTRVVRGVGYAVLTGGVAVLIYAVMAYWRLRRAETLAAAIVAGDEIYQW
jgi:hypothetical protein